MKKTRAEKRHAESLKLRDEILSLYLAGKTAREIAHKLGVTTQWVYQVALAHKRVTQ